MERHLTTGTDLEARRLRALHLRIEEALSYREIAEEMGVGVGTAFDYVRDGLKLYRQDVHEKIEDRMDMELQRLDNLHKRMFRKLQMQTRTLKNPKDGKEVVVADPQEETVRTMLLLIRERLEVVGGYAPKQTHLKVTPGAGSALDHPRGMDLSKLSTEELRTLDSIFRRAAALPAEVIEVTTEEHGAGPPSGMSGEVRQIPAGTPAAPKASWP